MDNQGLIAVFKNFVWILLGIGNSIGCSADESKIFTRVDRFKEFLDDFAGLNSRSNYESLS